MPSNNTLIPAPLSRRIEIAKLVLRVRRYKSPTLNNLPAQVGNSADGDRIERLRTEMDGVYRRDPVSAAKYASPRSWLLLNTLRAAQLGLHTSSGLRILDIGCGPGYFLATARALGHQCQGVDAPADCLTSIERRVYGELLEALHCRPYVSPLLIQRYVRLPFADRLYDLITAYWICFNRHRQVDEWGVEEWRFFLEDALRCLRKGGRLLLDLNPHPERYGTLCYYDPATLDYFRSAGTVDNGRVLLVHP